MKLSKRLDNSPEYFFSKLAKKKLTMEEKTGKRVLDLSIGSPDFPPSPIYVRKFQDLVSEGKAHLYPGYGASVEFRDALISWYKKRFNVTLNGNQCLPLLGAKDGVSHLSLALLDEGDEVLVPDPGYPGFSGPAALIGARPVFYDLSEENNFKIDLKKLEEKISPKTKFIWVNFPSNPTGQVVTIDELKPLVHMAKKHDVLIVYDNAYSDITFNGFRAPSILEIEGADEIAVEIGSFSKSFSFAGYRMGWIVGNGKVVAALATIKSQFDSGMSSFLQKLGSFALNNPDHNWQKAMISSYEKRRDRIIDNLKKIGLNGNKNRGSLYLWVKIPDSWSNSQEFALDLLEKKQILLTPGTAFGKNGKRYVRVSISSNIDGIEEYFE